MEHWPLFSATSMCTWSTETNGEQSHLRTRHPLGLVTHGLEVEMRGESTSLVASFPPPNKAHFTILEIFSDWSLLQGNGRGWRPRKGRLLEADTE